MFNHCVGSVRIVSSIPVLGRVEKSINLCVGSDRKVCSVKEMNMCHKDKLIALSDRLIH